MIVNKLQSKNKDLRVKIQLVVKKGKPRQKLPTQPDRNSKFGSFKTFYFVVKRGPLKRGQSFGLYIHRYVQLCVTRLVNIF